MNSDPLPEDLRVFSAVVRKASFSGAAEELGVSASYVTKRIRILEETLTTRLFHRTTRRVVVTEEGERVYHWALKILDDVDHLVEEIGITRLAPRGSLRVCSSFGFGRRVVAPALAALVEEHPSLRVRFEVFDRLVDVATEGFDLDVRVGDEIAPHLIAKRLASNHRVLCAAPSYLEKHGVPGTLSDLAAHDCLIIKERDHPFGVWRLRNGKQESTIKVRGPLSSNNGEMVVNWAVKGRGVALRSTWDVGSLIAGGKLVHILPEYSQEANVWAVYPSRLSTSAKVRVCVDYLQSHIGEFLQHAEEWH
ncbi:LysR substrate-binding domain-containing protein [Roseateles violae]|uniref:LysR substrate-binding domain-containing protein n=1 Tax=Roseateles violae TaxID=3058042 RepID=A0ABT8DQR1_9BURK|nr:LysR substrate-binding domain-containing protein [Pelomonas sp. PFR6]MDN3919395.1 LysR substrate-binding domain-containing protein [Pelomonas sp. PFR6]